MLNFFFAQKVIAYTVDKKVTLVRIKCWNYDTKATKSLPTKAEVKVQEYRDDIVDLDKAHIDRRLGIVELGHVTASGSIKWQDIRLLGLASNDLKLRSYPNWHREDGDMVEKLQKPVKLQHQSRSTFGRMKWQPDQNITDLRKLSTRETETFPKATVLLVCPQACKGKLIGQHFCHRNSVVEEYNVEIRRPNKNDGK